MMVQTAATSDYTYRTYGQVVFRLRELERRYPEYVELFTTQERYGLDVVDTSCKSLRKEAEKHNQSEEPRCEHYVVRLTHKPSWQRHPSRPHVFFSGNLHGDEKVGPMAVLGFIEWLLKDGASGNSLWPRQLLQTRVIVAIPITNPWGYEHSAREEKNLDPNRDFPHGVNPSDCMKTIVARSVNEVWREHLFQIAIT